MYKYWESAISELTDILTEKFPDWSEQTKLSVVADMEKKYLYIEKVGFQCKQCGQTDKKELVWVRRSSNTMLCIDCIESNIEKLTEAVHLEKKKQPLDRQG